MSLIFTTDNPTTLLDSFKKKIDEKKILTWSYDSDGDFTHNTDQWKDEAWLKPVLNRDNLTFKIIKPKIKNISREVYAIFHGRFIEAMLAHCDSLFIEVKASAYPDNGDNVIS